MKIDKINLERFKRKNLLNEEDGIVNKTII